MTAAIPTTAERIGAIGVLDLTLREVVALWRAMCQSDEALDALVEALTEAGISARELAEGWAATAGHTPADYLLGRHEHTHDDLVDDPALAFDAYDGADCPHCPTADDDDRTP